MSKVAYGGDDRHLHQRGGRWHYQRRVPRAFAHIDSRAYSKKALKTSSLEVARKRRDLIEQADDEWWMALAVQAAQTGGMNGDGASILRAAAEQRYKAAVTRAIFNRSNNSLEGIAVMSCRLFGQRVSRMRFASSDLQQCLQTLMQSFSVSAEFSKELLV